MNSPSLESVWACYPFYVIYLHVILHYLDSDMNLLYVVCTPNLYGSGIESCGSYAEPP